MKFDKILIVGCSFTAGHGFPLGKDDPDIWASKLSEKLGATTFLNASESGQNNLWIFLETVSQLIKNHYDLVLVQWTAIPRFKSKVGLELYPVDTMFRSDVNIVGHQTISKFWLEEIKNRLLRLHNDHWDILDLIKYINTLIEIQVTNRGGRIFFINGLAPWSPHYFEKKLINLPSDLDSYTQNLLDVDLRDDLEIFKLYAMIHQYYDAYGGIQEKYWLNLYESMDKLKIDSISAADQNYPGIKSQTLYVDYFYQQIQKLINENSHDYN